MLVPPYAHVIPPVKLLLVLYCTFQLIRGLKLENPQNIVPYDLDMAGNRASLCGLGYIVALGIRKEFSDYCLSVPMSHKARHCNHGIIPNTGIKL